MIAAGIIPSVYLQTGDSETVRVGGLVGSLTGSTVSLTVCP